MGDTLFAYVYLDPANPPSEVMLQWNDGSWEHRAYWGANLITWGTDGTVSRRYMGPLPATGQWVRLAVPASQVGLEGHTLNGMAYTLYNGRATWDYAGKTAAAALPTYQVSGTVTLGGAALSGVILDRHQRGELLDHRCHGQLRVHGAAGMVGHGHTLAERLHVHADLTQLQQCHRQPDGAGLAAATLPTYQVSGTVTLSGAALSGVALTATNGVSLLIH